MGYLAYGAMAGVGKEFLKQSEETRKRDFTLIRDKRLKEMQGELIDQRQGHLTAREEASDERLVGREKTKATALKAQQDADREAKAASDKAALDYGRTNYEFGYGDTVVRDGEIKHTGKDKPLAGSTAAGLTYQKWMDESVELLNGSRETMGSLRDDWEDVAYEEFDNPEFPGMGLKIKRRNPAIKDFPLWLNEQVIEKDRLNVNDPKYMQGDPDALFKHAQGLPQFKHPRGRQNAIDAIKNAKGADGQPLYPWWKGPAEDRGAVNPGTEGPNQGALPVPDKLPNPVNNEGPNADIGQQQAGMLSQATDTASQSPGRIVESSRDIQSVISRLENQIVHSKGPKGDPTRIPGLQQQLNQYKILLQRALAQESQRVSGGPSSVPGSAPQPPPTQMAQR